MNARLFVAVDIAETERAALEAWARTAVGGDPALRVGAVDRIHLTLAFLGHRPAGEIDELVPVVRGAAAPVGPLGVAGPLWLAPRRPHVLTVELDDPRDELGSLHDRTWSALEELGHERERRAFRPHLTVARVRHRSRPRTLEVPPVGLDEVTPEALTLYRSHLGGREPARYEALERVII